MFDDGGKSMQLVVVLGFVKLLKFQRTEVIERRITKRGVEID